MKKTNLALLGGLALSFCIASQAASTQLEVVKEGNMVVVNGSILNQGANTIMFDATKSGSAFQNTNMPTPINSSDSPTFKVTVPEGGFQDQQLRYSDGKNNGCVFYFNGGSGMGDPVQVTSNSFGMASCTTVGNNLGVNVIAAAPPKN